MEPLHVHILYQHGPDGRPYGCSYIRLVQPLTHPLNRGAFRVTHGTNYAGADVVILERTWKSGMTPAIAGALVDRVRKDRALLVYTIDDNLLDLGEVVQLSDHRMATTAECMAVRYLVRQADGVIVSTECLKDRLARMSAKIAVVPNALDERLFVHRRDESRAARTRHDQTIVGFMGTFTHDADIMLILQPLREVIRRYRGRLEFQIVGGVADRATLQPFEGLPVRVLDVGRESEYPSFVRWMIEHLAWDLAIAPLEDNVFNRCKSDIKFLDYSALGIPGIYSRVPAYERTVRHLETGYLADNTPEAWLGGLERLLADEALRERLSMQAERYVRSHRMLEQCALAWQDAILAFDRAEPTLDARPVQLRQETTT